jgi:hypothetical protein
VQIKTQVTIQRPRDEVYRRFADDLASTYPLVCPVTSVKMDRDTSIAVGVTGQMTVKNLFMSAIVDFTVTRYEKGQRFSFQASRGARSSQADYLFRDTGTGTLVTMITEAPAVGPRWLQGHNQRALDRHERQDAQRLKALLEGRQKDPAKAHRRAMTRLVLIAVALGAILGAAVATYQAFTMGA